MTMKITIKNEDTHRTAKVTQRDVGVDGSRHPHPTQTLQPGDSGEFWVHSTNELLVEEAAEAALPKAE